jgi:uncharacterized coiled-coil DUF342 family protein
MENKFDIGEFQKQFKALVDENNKLRNLRNNYVEYSDKLVDISKRVLIIQKELEELSKEIDPMKTVANRASYKRFDKEQFEDIYNKLQEGVSITNEFLQFSYSCSYQQANTIMNKLAKMQNVDVAKDGVKKRLFKRRG